MITEAAGRVNRLDGLRRIGIDEVAYRKEQRYLLVTWNHAACPRQARRRYQQHDQRAAEVAGAGSSDAEEVAGEVVDLAVGVGGQFLGDFDVAGGDELVDEGA